MYFSQWDAVEGTVLGCFLPLLIKFLFTVDDFVFLPPKHQNIWWMEEILHQLVDVFSHVNILISLFTVFHRYQIVPIWCRVSEASGLRRRLSEPAGRVQGADLRIQVGKSSMEWDVEWIIYNYIWIIYIYIIYYYNIDYILLYRLYILYRF